MNLVSAMELGDEEDLWIGDNGVSSHMMGSEEHMFNKKLRKRRQMMTQNQIMKAITTIWTLQICQQIWSQQ